MRIKFFKNLYWFAFFFGLTAYWTSRGSDGYLGGFILLSILLGISYCILMPVVFKTRGTLHSFGHFLSFELAVLIGSGIDSHLDGMAGMLPMIMATVILIVALAGASSLVVVRLIVECGGALEVLKLPRCWLILGLLFSVVSFLLTCFFEANYFSSILVFLGSLLLVGCGCKDLKKLIFIMLFFLLQSALYFYFFFDLINIKVIVSSDYSLVLTGMILIVFATYSIISTFIRWGLAVISVNIGKLKVLQAIVTIFLSISVFFFLTYLLHDELNRISLRVQLIEIETKTRRYLASNDWVCPNNLKWLNDVLSLESKLYTILSLEKISNVNINKYLVGHDLRYVDQDVAFIFEAEAGKSKIGDFNSVKFRYLDSTEGSFVSFFGSGIEFTPKDQIQNLKWQPTFSYPENYKADSE